MKNKKKLIGIIVIVAVVLFAGAYLLGTKLRPYSYHGRTMSSTEPPGDFTLVTHYGQRMNLSDYEGDWVVLYYGYTFCPDVCPTTLMQLGRMMPLLGKKAEHVHVFMVSVDPERDTAERMKEYVTYFHPDFVGLIGTPEEVADAAAPFGIYYKKKEVEGASDYLLDHTASVTIIDPDGRVRLIWPYGTTAEEMAEDLLHLMR
jgi:protein SCO1/2